MIAYISQNIRIGDHLAVLDTIDLATVGRKDAKAHLITRINVPMEERGKGFGNQLLRQAIAEADAHGITLFLDPVPYYNGPLDVDALRAWYGRNGFEGTTSNLMRRLPK